LDRILGVKGIYTPSEDTYRLTLPRADVKVSVGDRLVPPFLGLASTAAITTDPHHGGSLLIGELALFEDEVNPVLSVALDNELNVTGLHNVFLFEEPRVLFLHITAIGNLLALAARLRKLLDTIETIRRAHPSPSLESAMTQFPGKSNITASVLDSILEAHGQVEDGMYKVSMGMRGLVLGIPVGHQMGLETWAAFSGTDEKTLLEGEIVMTRDQIQDVLRALRTAAINIAALDHPMIDDRPEFFFVQYWGQGRAVDLARGLRRALETQLQ